MNSIKYTCRSETTRANGNIGGKRQKANGNIEAKRLRGERDSEQNDPNSHTTNAFGSTG